MKETTILRIPLKTYIPDKYLTVIKPLERSQKSTAAARRVKEEKHLQHLEDEMLQRDAVNDLNDLENASTLPNGFEKIRKDSQLIYFYTDENFSYIIASIVINNDLTVTIFFNGKKVSSSKIRHLFSRDRFRSTVSHRVLR